MLWLVVCDRGAALDGDVNEMHAVGLALCKALAVHEVPAPMPDDEALLYRID